ncbi:MAG TPA: hybrid sensor histidine kinase/response regulator [Burkholderiales bacterium]|nr:hybrid sensor histidine kinase/response regulator [Burkholderiales bacterium]
MSRQSSAYASAEKAGERSLAPAATWQEELLRVLLRQSQRVILPNLLTSLVVVGMAFGRLPTPLLAGWLVIVVAAHAIRRITLGWLVRAERLEFATRLRIAAVLSGLVGISHGLSAGFFPFLPSVERALVSLWLVAACAASVVSTVGYLPVFLAYIVPILSPVIAMWALGPGIAEHRWIESATAALVLMLGGLLVTYAKDSFRLFRESFEIRLQRLELNRRLEAALHEAELANRAKTRFLASASHDLRQPAHTASLFAAALSMRALDAESREIVQHLNSAVQALATQLDALLDISKLDAGVVRPSRAPLRLGALLERMQREFAPLAGAKGIALAVSCPPVAWVATDATLLERVVRNLLDNAVKYTDTGRVDVRVEPEAGGQLLTISDSGRGIPEAEQTRVFDEFYQLGNPERDRAKGLGLGLAIVKRLVSLLEIDMEMTSSPGAGTRFRLVLPRAREGAERAEDAATMRTPAALNVLVIDDEAEVRLGMKILLEGMGCRATLAEGTAEALAAARTARPDVVVADFRLRGTDNGIEAVRAVRALHPHVPALLVSGDIASDQLREAERAGIAFLHKPVPAETLKRAIADAVSG